MHSYTFFKFFFDLETRELIKQRTIEALRDPKVISCKIFFFSGFIAV